MLDVYKGVKMCIEIFKENPLPVDNLARGVLLACKYYVKVATCQDFPAD